MTTDTGAAVKVMQSVIRAARDVHKLHDTSPIEFRVVYERAVLAFFPEAEVGYGVWCRDTEGARALVTHFDGAVA